MIKDCFSVLGFRGRELLEVIDEFNDDLHSLASTKGSLSALVGGQNRT